MEEDNSLASEAARVPLKWVWTAAVAIAVCAVGIFDPAEALNDVIRNKGLSSEQVEAGAFIAGYTAPLTVATAITVYLALSGRLARMEGGNAFLAVALIYVVAGALSAELGLGLAPSEAFPHISGNPRFALPVNTLLSFFTAYGAPLMAAGAVLGTAVGLTAWRWTDPEYPPV